MIQVEAEGFYLHDTYNAQLKSYFALLAVKLVGWFSFFV